MYLTCCISAQCNNTLSMFTKLYIMFSMYECFKYMQNLIRCSYDNRPYFTRGVNISLNISVYSEILSFLVPVVFHFFSIQTGKVDMLQTNYFMLIRRSFFFVQATCAAALHKLVQTSNTPLTCLDMLLSRECFDSIYSIRYPNTI